MIRKPTRFVALAVLLGGVSLAPYLGDSDSTWEVSSDPALPPAPVLHVSLRPDDLALAGHTLSIEQEETLSLAARHGFPEHRITTNYEPLGIVPNYWPALSLRLIDILRHTQAAEVTLAGSLLTLRAVISHKADWQRQLDAFEKTLPADVSLVGETLLGDPSVSAEKLCERAMANFSIGPVNFEESSMRLRSSAYPRLDRLAALARTCKEPRILIIGHTDASGSEAWNLRLSMMRASAVGEYLADHGVSRKRLQIAGIGSGEPVASNDTRYGRSLNRRIEIRFDNNPD